VPNATLTRITRLSAVEVDALIDEHFPAIHFGGRTLSIDALTERGALVRLKSHPKNLRPGNTVSGPAMFTLVDYGVYVAILAHLGDSALQSVTTSITLNFMNRPQPGDLIAEINLLKIGKRLIVTEMKIFADGKPEMVAHATATYAMPSRSG
jgi:uncharacterized protein (TIGR00369 family)